MNTHLPRDTVNTMGQGTGMARGVAQTSNSKHRAAGAHGHFVGIYVCIINVPHSIGQNKGHDK